MHAARGDAAIPSLFVDDAAPGVPMARPGLLAELEAPLDARRRTPRDLLIRLRGRRWPVAAAVVAFAGSVLALALLAGGGGAYPERADAQRATPGAREVAPAGAAAVRPAVILDEPPPPRVVATEGNVVPSAGSEEDPMQMLRGRVAPASVPAPRRRAATPVDTDVDLLAALMHHAGRSGSGRATAAGVREGPGPAATLAIDRAADATAREDALLAVSRALAACPAANTDAGLACRGSVCSAHWGEHPSCPRPSASNAGQAPRGSDHAGSQ